MRQVLPLALSAVTVVMMWKVGDLKVWAWALGLANQSLWLVFIFVFEAWGLLPLCAFLIVTYTRNLVKWRREAALLAAHPPMPS